jgi:hypothetical protein
LKIIEAVMSKKVLGRGLGAFFPEYEEEENRILKGNRKM